MIDYKKKYLKYKKKYLEAKNLYGGSEEMDDKIFNTEILIEKCKNNEYQCKEIYKLLNNISDNIKANISDEKSEKNLFEFIKKLYDCSKSEITVNDMISYLYPFQEDPKKLNDLELSKKIKNKNLNKIIKKHIEKHRQIPPNPATFLAESIRILEEEEEEEKEEEEVIKPTLKGKRKCIYGIGCYRKNKKHREDFIHP